MNNDDRVASAARRALYRIGFANSILLRWADICARARGRQRRRIAVGVVIGAALLTGAGAANALVARDTSSSKASDDGTARIGTTTVPVSTSSSTTETAPASTAQPAGSEVPPPPAVTATTGAPTTTTEPVLEPYEAGVQYTAFTTAERAQVAVGDDVVLHATLHNTGTRAFHTEGYGSIGVACAPWPVGSSPDVFDMGAFIPDAVLEPGETQTFTVTVTAHDYVGTVFCGVGFAFHGDAFAAGPNYDDTSKDAFVEIVAPGDTTTTTIEPTSTTVASAGA